MSGVDSRRWTGPAAEPAPPPNRRASRAAFRAAGGEGASAPQRTVALVFWLGLPVMLGVILIGADGRSRLLGLEALAARVRDGFRSALEAALSGVAGSKDAEGLVALAGDPRLAAALLAMVGALAGLASVTRHRAALRRGFAAAEANHPGTVFITFHGGVATPLLLVLVGTKPPGGALFALNAPTLWFVAFLAVAGTIAVVERRAAGLGTRGAARSGWDAATIAVSLGAMIVVLAHALGTFG